MCVQGTGWSPGGGSTAPDRSALSQYRSVMPSSMNRAMLNMHRAEAEPRPQVAVVFTSSLRDRLSMRMFTASHMTPSTSAPDHTTTATVLSKEQEKASVPAEKYKALRRTGVCTP